MYWVFLYLTIIFFLSGVAEDESEPEEEEDRSEEKAKEPRDSGCFESSENLESGREEAKTEEDIAPEEQTNQVAVKQEQQQQQQEEEEEQQEEEVVEEEKQTEQLEAVQEQLQELTVDEGSWEEVGKILKLQDSDGGLKSGLVTRCRVQILLFFTFLWSSSFACNIWIMFAVVSFRDVMKLSSFSSSSQNCLMSCTLIQIWM